MSLNPSEPRIPDHAPDDGPIEPRLLTRREGSGEPPREHPRRALFASLSRPRFSRLHLSRPRRARPEEDFARRSFNLPVRRVFLTLGLLVALAIAGLIATSAWLRHSMRAALPQLDGTLHVSGLGSPVAVTRDAQGVPSIHAASLDDLLFAQGFVTAQDRLWQMDMVRRHAAGELAEILGPNLIEHDRMQRTLQMRAAADRAVALLPADQLHQLDAYARGVNAFIAQNSDRLPVEFHLLHYKPAPWTPRDSLLVSLVMFQDLSTEFPTKLRREAFAGHMPARLLPDLYPVGSWRDHPPSQPPPDLTAPVTEIQQIPLDRSQSLLHTPQPANPADILRIADEFPSQRCDGCRAGSNNWAVAGSHSASGAPLLSNDMHLSLSVPDIWYEAGLHSPATATTPALDVTGFTLPGVPLIIVGRNAHIAWSFTNLGADVQDVRVEHLRGSGANTEFEHPDGTWSPVGHHIEHIRVRDGRDIDLDVLTTTETIGSTQIATPIISPLLPSEHRALSLAWTIYDPANIPASFLGVDAANDGASLVAALAGFGGPSLNLIYADDGNHIGYHALGRIPIRGPAVHRPRAIPPLLPTGPAPPDEDDQPNDDDEPTSPQASLGFSSHPMLLEATYVRSRRRHRAPRLLRRRHPMLEEQQAAPPLATSPITAPATDYTIGSPISPVPVDALDASQIWSGYIPYNDLPSVVDPPNGILATANARIATANYPYAIAIDWAPPYRVERIDKLLEGRTALTPSDMLSLQNDVHSEFDLVVAQRLAYALDHASPTALAHAPGAFSRDKKRLRQAADILRAWNGEVSANAAAPTIVAATRSELWAMLLLPQIVAHDKALHRKIHPREVLALYQWSEQDDALEELLQHTPDRWLPPGFANWNDLLTAAVEYALQEAHAPSDLSSWRFGPVHPIEIDHPLFSIHPVFDRLLGTATGSGPRLTGGDATTIKAIGSHFGPSERFTADLANPAATIANIATGESGDPASPYYFDQFLPWLYGTTFALPLEAPQSTHTLTLLP